MNDPMDVFIYRKIILGGLEPSKYITVSNSEIDYYYKKKITTFIQNDKFMVGYNIPTIDGNIYMPVFCHKYGQNKCKMLEQLLEKTLLIFKEKQVNTLFQIGLPYDITQIIKTYL